MTNEEKGKRVIEVLENTQLPFGKHFLYNGGCYCALGVVAKELCGIDPANTLSDEVYPHLTGVVPYVNDVWWVNDEEGITSFKQVAENLRYMWYIPKENEDETEN